MYICTIFQGTSYDCALCQATFKRKDNLKRHMKQCGQKETQWQCSKCSVTFTRKDNYKRHQSQCGKLSVNFPCPTCSSKFHRNDNLKVHEKKCKKDTYTCQFCGKYYRVKSNLVQHQKICAEMQHLSPRQFRCSNCRETFANRRDLYHHRLTQHGGAEVNA